MGDDALGIEVGAGVPNCGALFVGNGFEIVVGADGSAGNGGSVEKSGSGGGGGRFGIDDTAGSGDVEPTGGIANGELDAISVCNDGPDRGWAPEAASGSLAGLNGNASSAAFTAALASPSGLTVLASTALCAWASNSASVGT